MINLPDCRQIRVASIRDTGVKFRIRLRLPLLDVTDNGGGVVGVIDALPFARSQGDKRNGNGAKRRSSRRALLSLRASSSFPALFFYSRGSPLGVANGLSSFHAINELKTFSNRLI